jgi:hypothetical protein
VSKEQIIEMITKTKKPGQMDKISDLIPLYIYGLHPPFFFISNFTRNFCPFVQKEYKQLKIKKKFLDKPKNFVHILSKRPDFVQPRRGKIRPDSEPERKNHLLKPCFTAPDPLDAGRFSPDWLKRGAPAPLPLKGHKP